MKKILCAALAAIVLAATISGCSDKKEISDTSSENSTAVNNSSDTESTAESTESTESTTESTPDENSESEGGNGGGVDNSGLEYSDNKAGRIVKAILAEDAWSFMMLMDEETAPTLIPDFSIDDCEEYCLAYCGMSTQLQYAIAVKPKAGSEEKVENVLAAFYENIKNNPDLAFYPMQQASAEGAVMDTTDDGYICVVVHENGQAIADAVENVQ